MNNKLLNNIVYTIALFSLTGIAVAEPADSDAGPLFNEQQTHIPSEYILSEMYTVVNDRASENPEAKNPVHNRKKSNTLTTDNFQWMPEDWYSAY